MTRSREGPRTAKKECFVLKGGVQSTGQMKITACAKVLGQLRKQVWRGQESGEDRADIRVSMWSNSLPGCTLPRRLHLTSRFDSILREEEEEDSQDLGTARNCIICHVHPTLGNDIFPRVKEAAASKFIRESGGSGDTGVC